MAIQKIVQKDAPVLRDAAEPLSDDLFGTTELQQIIDDMSDSLATQQDGVALAAPQIGVSQRIFIVAGHVFPRTPDGAVLPDLVFINPEITQLSDKTRLLDEGCLSVRGAFGRIERAVHATIRAHNVHGDVFEMEGSDLLAQIFQHETDHLNGTLFIDNAVDIEYADA